MRFNWLIVGLLATWLTVISTSIPTTRMNEMNPMESEFTTAIVNGQLNEARELYESGKIDIDRELEGGMSYLHLAISTSSPNKIEIVRFILEKTDRLEALNSFNQSPMYLAAASGNSEIVRMLYEKGRGMGQVNGLDPLMVAVDSDHLSVVQEILSRDQPLETYDLLLKRAIDHEAYSVAKFIVQEKGPRLTSQIDHGFFHSLSHANPLHGAVRRGGNNIEFVRFLVESGAGLNDEDEGNLTPLDWTLRLRNFDLAKTLIKEYGARSSSSSGSGMLELEAIYSGDWELLDCVLRNGGDYRNCPISIPQTNFMHLIIRSDLPNRLAMLQNLLVHVPEESRPAFINYYREGTCEIKGRQLETPISEAAKLGQWDVVYYLLKVGGDPFLGPKGQPNALDYAVTAGKVEIVREILERFPNETF